MYDHGIVSFRVTAAAVKRLEWLAEVSGVSRSELLRLLIEQAVVEPVVRNTVRVGPLVAKAAEGTRPVSAEPVM